MRYNFIMIVFTMVFGVLLGCTNEEVEEPAKSAEKEGNVSGDADVTNVFAREESDGLWTFHVSVKHDDVNWYDFADGWDVVLPDGTSVKPDPFGQFTRHIRHPHVHEQPFTRTQKEVEIPEGVDRVRVRAHDKKHGWGGQEIEVLLNVRFGENYSVKRKL